MTTSSEEEAHGALLMVQRRVTLPDAANPVTPELGEDGVVIVAVPDTTVQLPVPVEGVFPDSVVVVTSQARV